MNRRLVKFFLFPNLLLTLFLALTFQYSAQTISGIVNSYVAVTAVTTNTATLT
ncbi:MAG: hypothetical protein FJZ67_08850, partial [Bacteroidetes bacterium]|nr:hypothetical protein [Bacteroidota bacterium]